MFTPVQVAAIAALEGDQTCVEEICDMYRNRRDVLCDGLNAAGWHVEKPKATMFVWAKIPEQFQNMGSLEFSKFLLKKPRWRCRRVLVSANLVMTTCVSP